MKILIFENAFQLTGHRIPYASLVSKAFGLDDVIVAVPHALSGESSLLEYFQAEQLKFYDAEKSASHLGQAWESSRCLFRLIRELRPDRVLVPTADGMAVIGWISKWFFGCGLRHPPIDIALMIGRRPEAGLGLRAKTMNKLKWRAIQLGPWRKLMLMDPRSYSELDSNERVLLAPDPVPARLAGDKDQSRRRLGIDPGGRLIVSAGNQNTRKGVDDLINAFCNAKIDPQDKLLLIGNFSNEIRVLIESIKSTSRWRQVICRDQFVSDFEFSQSILAADLVATPYRNTQRPSGVISRCIAWGVPFWGSNTGWPRWAIDQFEAGYPVHRSTPESTARSLSEALHKCGRFMPSERAKAFAVFNTAENYQSAWQQLVQSESVVKTLSPEFFIDVAP